LRRFPQQVGILAEVVASSRSEVDYRQAAGERLAGVMRARIIASSPHRGRMRGAGA
jgi:hypothetical protein